MTNGGERGARVVVASILAGLAAGCAHIDPEALTTLSDQSKDGALSEEAYKREEAGFLAIRDALSSGNLSTGEHASAIAKRFGPPVVSLGDAGGRRWAYKSRYGDWFRGPKIDLILDSHGRLAGWNCEPESECRP